jgi:hypothetical protein
MRKVRNKLFIQVLQNGVALAENEFSLTRKKYIRVGGERFAELRLPFYESTFKLFKISSGAAGAFIPKSAQGFIKRQDGFHGLEHKGQNQLMIHPGDFGKIEVNDLQVLFKISPIRQITKSTINSRIRMRDGIFSYIFQNTIEWRSTMIALLVSAACLWSWYRHLSEIAPTPKQKFEDLDTAYKIPFIHARHITNLPEAIRDQLDQSNWINQSIDYAKAFASVIFDWEDPKKSFFLTEPLNYYARLKSKQVDKTHQLIEERVIKDKSAKAVPGKSVLYVPSVTGESLEQLIHYTLAKMDLAHDAHERFLNQRIGLSKKFKDEVVIDLKPPTTAPDFIKLEEGQGYRQALAGPVDSLSDEEYMYEKGRLLAQKAYTSTLRDHFSTSIITIDTSDNFLSFLGEASVNSIDQKLMDLKSKAIDTGAKPKEPQILYGYINPKVVENTIAKYSHELKLCYELALRRNNDAKGKMEWSFEINTKGSIGKIKLLTSDIDDTQMVRCIQRKMASWVFPRPDRGKIEVTYPFHFSKG